MDRKQKMNVRVCIDRFCLITMFYHVMYVSNLDKIRQRNTTNIH